MKTNAIVRIILYSIAIVVLLGILIAGIAVGMFMVDFDWSTQSEAHSASGSVSADQIRNISIDWAAGSITICPSDVTEITLSESSNKECDPMVWMTAGDTLKVSYWEKQPFLHFGSTPSKDLLILVPWNWTCGELDIETAAANLQVENLTIGKVDFDGASGICRFDMCSVDAIDLDTASGNIQFTGTLNTLDCDAASADCEIVLSNSPKRIEMDMASGDLELTLPECCGFAAKLDSLSGSFDTDFDVTHSGGSYISGDGSCRIDVSAMSGKVYISKSTEATNCDH